MDIFGCFGFQVNHKWNTLDTSNTKCFYAIIIYMILARLFFKNASKTLNNLSANFHTLNSVKALIKLVDMLGYLLPPIFIVLSILFKTKAQILFFNKLSAFSDKIKMKLGPQERRWILKYSAKSEKSVLLVPFLAVCYFFVLSIIYGQYLGFDKVLITRLSIYTYFSTLSVLVTAFLIILLKFLMKHLRIPKKFHKSCKIFQIFTEFNQLVAAFNEAFGLLYFGCYLFSSIEYSVNLYYAYVFMIQLNNPEKDKPLFVLLVFVCWTALPLFLLFYVGHCCAKLKNQVSFYL